jgi:hypothetical protein
MQKYFIIPQKKRSLLATIEQSVIVPVRQIDIPFESKSVITDNGYIVSLYRTNKKLRVHDLDGRLIYKNDDFCFDALNVKGNIVYLGGEYNSASHEEIFSILDLNRFPFKFKQAEFSIELKPGKTIDDILIRDNILMLVYNLVFHKYILEYNIENPEAPSFIKLTHLPRNGTYENIKKGDINADYMVLFSMTVGSRGVSQHIIVSGKTIHIIKRSISAAILMSDDFDNKKSWSYLDVCLVDDNLLLVRTDGVGYFYLHDHDLNDESFHFINTQLSDVHRIIKSPYNQPIVINENDYLSLEKNEWIIK